MSAANGRTSRVRDRFLVRVLAKAVLLTEANVIPAKLLDRSEPVQPVVRFWALAFVGNFGGAPAVGGG